MSGPLAGYQLDVFPIYMTTVAAALTELPDITISSSTDRSLRRKLAQKLYPQFIHGEVLLPGFFYASMNESIDPRLDKLTQGLGVIVGKRAKYYPMKSIPAEGIRDQWSGRVLSIKQNAISGVPYARWEDTNKEPMQLLSRWYGFSYTYPRCEIYEI